MNYSDGWRDVEGHVLVISDEAYKRELVGYLREIFKDSPVLPDLTDRAIELLFEEETNDIMAVMAAHAMLLSMANTSRATDLATCCHDMLNVMYSASTEVEVATKLTAPADGEVN